ncbi:MAG: DUF975 family protein [Oscillospiraceae bacterium]|nr:DUF975 family protein [Oscillospiraceae bacterium]
MVRHKLKLHAKGLILAPRKPHVIFVTLLYIAISILLLLIVMNLSELGAFQVETIRRVNNAAVEAFQLGTFPQVAIPELQISVLGLFFFVIPWILTWMVELGYLYYIRGIARGEDGLGYRSLFEGFNYFLKGLFIRLLSYAAISLGFVLLMVPGFVLIAAFSQANLLLLDNPDKNVFWHLRESTRLMRGHKWEYLVLRLSFIGWLLLMRIPFLHYAVRVWYTPYSTLTFVNYYHGLIGQGPKDPEDGWQKPSMF